MIYCDESSLNSTVLEKPKLLKLDITSILKYLLKQFLYSLMSLTSFILDSKFPRDTWRWDFVFFFLQFLKSAGR